MKYTQVISKPAPGPNVGANISSEASWRHKARNLQERRWRYVRQAMKTGEEHDHGSLTH
jgi:hypothetical protein